MMIRIQTLSIAMLISAFCVSDLNAQRRGSSGRGGDRIGDSSRMMEMMRWLPIMTALDTNEDGEISAEEIKHATEALRSLDKNDDGRLTEDEFRPDFRRMRDSDRKPDKRESRTDKAPKVGDQAPTFRLKSLDGKTETDLAEFKGKKPVILLFGSYT